MSVQLARQAEIALTTAVRGVEHQSTVSPDEHKNRRCAMLLNKMKFIHHMLIFVPCSAAEANGRSGN